MPTNSLEKLAPKTVEFDVNIFLDDLRADFPSKHSLKDVIDRHYEKYVKEQSRWKSPSKLEEEKKQAKARKLTEEDIKKLSYIGGFLPKDQWFKMEFGGKHKLIRAQEIEGRILAFLDKIQEAGIYYHLILVGGMGRFFTPDFYKYLHQYKGGTRAWGEIIPPHIGSKSEDKLFARRTYYFLKAYPFLISSMGGVGSEECPYEVLEYSMGEVLLKELRELNQFEKPRILVILPALEEGVEFGFSGFNGIFSGIGLLKNCGRIAKEKKVTVDVIIGIATDYGYKNLFEGWDRLKPSSVVRISQTSKGLYLFSNLLYELDPENAKDIFKRLLKEYENLPEYIKRLKSARDGDTLLK